MQTTVTLTALLRVSALDYVDPADLADPEKHRHLTFMAGDTTYFEKNGYILMGTATATFNLVDGRAVVDGAVTALQQEAAAIRAEATAKCTAIEGKINQLLAIEMDPAPLEGVDVLAEEVRAQFYAEMGDR